MSSSGARRFFAIVAIVCAALTLTTRSATPVYFPDDPLQVDNDRALDAGKAVRIEGSNAYDFAEQTFIKPGDHRPIPAVNVNTIDEVPDSSWFTNRIGRRAMSIDEIVRGPNTLDTPNIDDWPVVEGKSSGITPGYRVVGPDGRLYQVKFDPPSNPEMASGAEVIGAAFYHALGYNVVQGYIVEVDPDKVVIAPNATTVDLRGRKVPITRTNVDRLLRVAAKLPNGKYRATLSRFADGKPLGYFKYYGTRPDDPNDIHPHEHRRELRGSRVFAAWLNHDDSRGLNSLDMLERAGGRSWVKHYMFDFGSIMGSGTVFAQKPRAGNEYIFEGRSGLLTALTFGLYLKPWITIRYPDAPASVGRFEGARFKPEAWKPEYPNPAFQNMRPEDAFWGARLVSRFSADDIAAIVDKARYSDPAATAYVTRVLVERQRKVLATWLNAVTPLVDPVLSADGVFRATNAAIAAGVADAPRRYTARWFALDNAAGTRQPIGDAVEVAGTPDLALPLPVALASRPAGEYIEIEVTGEHPAHPGWARHPVTFSFRRIAGGWEPVGINREPKPPE
jgi:hypothetical protein